MKTILVPIDFSAVSQAVVREGARVAGFAKGRVILLHVVQPPIIMADYGLVLGPIAVYTDAAEKNADRLLLRLRAKLLGGGIAVQTVRVTGTPGLSILEQAKKWSADYIVIGSHGHSAFYDLLVGSTTSVVLKRAACPVVVVSSFKNAAPRAKK